MEALSFLKFWRPSSVTLAGAPIPMIEVEEEEEDSFFDLELSGSAGAGEKQSNFTGEQQQPTHDVFSKRKIIPVDPSASLTSPTTESPISGVKSSPKFGALKMTNGDTLFSLTRVNSVNVKSPEKKQSSGRELAVTNPSTSTRFAKDTIQKYFNRIKPRKNSSSNKFSCSPMSSPSPSPSSSPAVDISTAKLSQTSSRFRAVYKNLGKTKFFPAMTGIESPARRDDSLIQHNDSIQSAILHCKRSFNSSRESSMLSRSSSDSIKSLSSDCSVLSRFSSEQWIDSARSSSDEDCIIYM